MSCVSSACAIACVASSAATPTAAAPSAARRVTEWSAIVSSRFHLCAHHSALSPPRRKRRGFEALRPYGARLRKTSLHRENAMRSFRFTALILLSALCITPAAAQNLPHPPHPHHRPLPRRRAVRRAGAAHRRQDERRFPAAGGGREPTWCQYCDRRGGGRQGDAGRLHAAHGDRFDAGDEPVSLQNACPTIRSPILRRSRWWPRPLACSWSMRRAITNR